MELVKFQIKFLNGGFGFQSSSVRQTAVSLYDLIIEKIIVIGANRDQKIRSKKIDSCYHVTFQSKSASSCQNH